MELLRSMPSADSRVMRKLYRDRARDGLVVCAQARAASYPVDPDFPLEWGCLSIVAVRRGCESYHFPVPGRVLTVDDDSYLVLYPESRYSYRLRSRALSRCLMVSFPPWMLDSATGSLTDDIDEGLRASEERFTSWGEEHLSGHDAYVSPGLRAIERAMVQGVVEPEWYREQMAILLRQIFRKNGHESTPHARVRALRPVTRSELVRRARLASDLIHESYQQSVDLTMLGGAAGLSPFHLLRVFRDVYGVTPQEFLQRKRTSVARRLLATTRLSTAAAAARVGFRSRSSLYRWMRRVYGPDWSASMRYASSGSPGVGVSQ